MPISVRPGLEIPEDALEESFVRSGGPGGQNVNKVATTAQLRFRAAECGLLPPDMMERLARLAGRRMTSEGVLIIVAQRFRTQERNRADARDRLAELLIAAAERPKRRRPTRPTRASVERRLDGKAKAASRKAGRRPLRGDD